MKPPFLFAILFRFRKFPDEVAFEVFRGERVVAAALVFAEQGDVFHKVFRQQGVFDRPPVEVGQYVKAAVNADPFAAERDLEVFRRPDDGAYRVFPLIDVRNPLRPAEPVPPVRVGQAPPPEPGLVFAVAGRDEPVLPEPGKRNRPPRPVVGKEAFRAPAGRRLDDRNDILAEREVAYKEAVQKGREPVLDVEPGIPRRNVQDPAEPRQRPLRPEIEIAPDLELAARQTADEPLGLSGGIVPEVPDGSRPAGIPFPENHDRRIRRRLERLIVFQVRHRSDQAAVGQMPPQVGGRPAVEQGTGRNVAERPARREHVEPDFIERDENIGHARPRKPVPLHGVVGVRQMMHPDVGGVAEHEIHLAVVPRLGQRVPAPDVPPHAGGAVPAGGLRDPRGRLGRFRPVDLQPVNISAQVARQFRAGVPRLDRLGAVPPHHLVEKRAVPAAVVDRVPPQNARAPVAGHVQYAPDDVTGRVETPFSLLFRNGHADAAPSE